MKKLDFTALSAACLLALSTGAIGAMTKAEHKAAAGTIAATYTSDKSACKPMGGNAKDVCMQEAKGRDSVAKAELEATFSPSDKHHYDVRIAKADAAYAVSKEKCDDFAGNAKDVCRKEATSAHVTAKANAKVAEKSADANAAAAAHDRGRQRDGAREDQRRDQGCRWPTSATPTMPWRRRSATRIPATPSRAASPTPSCATASPEHGAAPGAAFPQPNRRNDHDDDGKSCDGNERRWAGRPSRARWTRPRRAPTRRSTGRRRRRVPRSTRSPRAPTRR